MYDTIIIGGGPAGITAGIYTVRKGLKTLIIAKDFIGQAGGASVVENWPGEKKLTGMELMLKFTDHIRAIGPEITEGGIVKNINKENDGTFSVITAEGKEEKAKTVIIASGRNPRPLKVPGEEELAGKGVSYCVICDGPLFKNKDVAVVGGGNSAFETALELKDYCQKVYILTLNSIADKALQDDAQTAENIEIIDKAILKEISGSPMVEKVTYEKEGSREEINVKGVFVAIGSIPVTEFMGDLVEFNNQGEIVIDHYTLETKTPGLFAAGDVTNVRDKQIVIACGEAAKAAISVHKYIQSQ